MKVARDLQLFEKWEKLGDVPQSGEQLGEMVGCDVMLLRKKRSDLVT